MHDRTLRRIHRCLLTQNYVVTTHADQEIDDDGLTISDVEHAILNGYIAERQRDRQTGEAKHRICGQSERHEPIEVVVKTGPTGRLIIITVFRSA